jgi:hypothetical protein
MDNEPTETRDIVLRLRDGGLHRISELHASYDSLQVDPRIRWMSRISSEILFSNLVKNNGFFYISRYCILNLTHRISKSLSFWTSTLT